MRMSLTNPQTHDWPRAPAAEPWNPWHRVPHHGRPPRQWAWQECSDRPVPETHSSSGELLLKDCLAKPFYTAWQSRKVVPKDSLPPSLTDSSPSLPWLPPHCASQTVPHRILVHWTPTPCHLFLEDPDEYMMLLPAYKAPQEWSAADHLGARTSRLTSGPTIIPHGRQDLFSFFPR